MQIDGPAGALEIDVDEAPANRNISAILCHPHPQYGGSMHDAVLQCAVDTLIPRGVNCVRFNFRGVGASGGSHDKGVGEVDDLLAVSAWTQDSYPEHEIWWLGYSFGAAMAWRAMQQATPARIFLIAPPVGMMDFSGTASAASIDAIAGDRDDFVDTDKLAAMDGITAHIVAGADHFFAGHHRELAHELEQILDAR